jgi:hypothetical protein
MVMPSTLPAVAAPMVRPMTVTVTPLLAATAAPVVTTIWVLVGVATAPPLTPLIVAAGDPVPEKKPDGYVSVMVLPIASAPPAVVVNEKVAAAELLPATRSTKATPNVTEVTAFLIIAGNVPSLVLIIACRFSFTTEAVILRISLNRNLGSEGFIIFVTVKRIRLPAKRELEFKDTSSSCKPERSIFPSSLNGDKNVRDDECDRETPMAFRWILNRLFRGTAIAGINAIVIVTRESPKILLLGSNVKFNEERIFG